MARITNFLVGDSLNGEGNEAVASFPNAQEVIAAKKDAKHPFAANNV
ncbi:hypothetical protein [Methylomonas fluvii]|nr:hypothetical protein [Methylomonas fluvii]CAD6876059.1 Formaldehyde activating enzyme [Methylomonas fluvii]